MFPTYLFAALLSRALAVARGRRGGRSFLCRRRILRGVAAAALLATFLARAFTLASDWRSRRGLRLRGSVRLGRGLIYGRRRRIRVEICAFLLVRIFALAIEYDAIGRAHAHGHVTGLSEDDGRRRSRRSGLQRRDRKKQRYRRSGQKLCKAFHWCAFLGRGLFLRNRSDDASNSSLASRRVDRNSDDPKPSRLHRGESVL
ncbi:MAG: hypothetical protein EA385_11145 [Salinarimonadaceae bacterium]|nr:MAG: hypothetical protein EA385_11145 [Salinarimonadaceae bacterium]